jgi:exodeoxyribonuclease V alpha subunit
VNDPAIGLPDGLLRDVHLSGVLGWGDVHVAQKVSQLFGVADQRAQLALALTVRALRDGSTCLELDQVASARYVTDSEGVATLPEGIWPEPDGWLEALAGSPMVTDGAEAEGVRPLRLVGRRLHLERYWQEETTVVAELSARRQIGATVVDADQLQAAASELLAEGVDAEQASATVVPLFTGVSVIAGGPGTGKTHTVARVLGMLSRTAERPLLIGLAAPTGKAAARMDEALAKALQGMPADLATELGTLRASTVHRLLGWVPESRNRFRHHRGNPLPHDVVVVDEASMVSVTLMARLLEAMRPSARLVLVGDPDQLSPVEAGAVLADIVAAPAHPVPGLSQSLHRLGLPDTGAVARLRHNHRSEQDIATLAEAVLAGDADEVAALATAGSTGVRFAPSVGVSHLHERAVRTGVAMVTAARNGAIGDALARLEEHRVLCAHRHGPYGVALWSRQVEDWLAAELGDLDTTRQWYPGRPVLVTENSSELGLFNGDTGVTVLTGGQLRVHFARGKQTRAVSPFLLDAVQTVHAMTVHKAQGSQFGEVSLILPEPGSPLLTRELLYTAITRAEHRVNLIGSIEALTEAVQRPARRASGLRDRL